MRVVLIADKPHGDRVQRELTALGHEVVNVEDKHGAGILAIHPGTTLVLAMNVHSDRERAREKAREVGASYLPVAVGWRSAERELRRVGFSFASVLPAPEPGPLPIAAPAQLALVPQAPAEPTPAADPVRAEGIVPFAFEGHEVRVQVDEAGEPWFCAADVCGCIDLDNVTMAVQCVRADEKAKKVQPSIELRAGVAPIAPQWFLSEPGLYRLLFRSDKPKAEPFQDWLARDVLPAIRRTGSYSVAPVPETREQLIARALLETSAIIAERDTTIAETQRALAAAKIETAEAEAQRDELITVAAVARTIGEGAGERTPTDAGKIWQITNATKVLVDLGYAYYRNDKAVPRAQYGHAGSRLLTLRPVPAEKCNGEARDQMYVTDKGLVVICGRLVMEGLTGADVLAEIRKKYGRRPEAA